MTIALPQHTAAEAPSTGETPGVLTISHLAHELNSLLDGSMRCLRIAQESLHQSIPDLPPATRDVIDRLETANQAMHRMARVLERTMRSSNPCVDILEEHETLEHCVRTAIETLTPLAAEAGVIICWDVTPRAGALPARTLGPVLINGIRNAIQSCARSFSDDRHVEVSIAVNSSDELMIVIADTGCTAASDLSSQGGHGIGLALCSQIVKHLSGDLRLTSIPFGRGAVLQVSVPVRSLVQHG